jgi:predicted ester cyclase
MSTEENKAVIRRIVEEAMNKGNLAVADEVIAPNYVYHGAGGQDFKGVEGFKQFMTIMRNAFPDLHSTVEDMVAEGDKVMHLGRIRGTFKGEMMGMAPTGKQIDITAATLSRFAGGKEVEAWQYIDTLAFYKQLGVSPPK